MVAPKRLTATVSANGRVILPRAIRDQHHWDAGTKLIFENTEDGVFLKTAPLLAVTEVESVFGSLAYTGRAKTIKAMDAAIAAEARRTRD